MSLKYTPVTHSILCLNFLMCVATIVLERFNVCSNHALLKYSGYKSKNNLQLHDSDIPVTLKQGQCHQIWYELVDRMQGFNNAKFEKPHLNQP